ncbi:MAG: methyl-accepting chemotaxis protein [Thiohalomonadaceae bacterium]
MKPSKAKTNTSGGNKSVVALIVLVVLMLIAAVSVFILVSLQDRNDKEYISLLGEQRVLSQRLSTYAGQATLGSDPAIFTKLKESYDRFEHNFDMLMNGNPATGMNGAPTEVLSVINAVDVTWKKYEQGVKVILAHRETVTSMRETVQTINDRAAQLLALADEVATLMANTGASPEQVYIASRQLMLSQRIVNNVNRVLEGGEGSVTAADRFGRDAALFGRVVDGLLEGNKGMSIQRVQDAGVRAKLQEVKALFTEIGEQVGAILERTPEMFQVSEAAFDVLNLSDDLLQRITDLEASYLAYIGNRKITSTVGSIFGGLALLMLGGLVLQLRVDGQRRLQQAENERQESEERNRRNQQAIMRLLDEMGDLADGDLTVNATVTEDVTGAIADSINYAIEALRTLVTAINDTATQVSQAAQQSQATAVQLAQASENQAHEISSASAAVNEMAMSIQGVSRNADTLAQEAQRSVATAKAGTEAVQKTIEGMNTIREQIQETSKRIKRLGESSQEIGDIVELINDIAEQTNILALNAAIQAAMAGEAGRGFAVVADEVQRLAERSADATKQIEALVKTIQTDTNEAVISMEQTTSEVVSGAKLAEDAGTALGTIESVANHLSELVQSISAATRQQAKAAANVSDTMNIIQEITNQTSAGTSQTAAAIGNLAELANALKKSVSGFKLPV